MFCDALKSISPVLVEYFVVTPLTGPTQSYGKRTVAHYELEYISKGSGHVVVNGVPCPAVDHTVHFRRPGEVVEGIGIYNARHFTFNLNPAEEQIDELLLMPTVYYFMEFMAIEQIFQAIFNAYFGESPTQPLTFKIHVMQLLELMINEWYANTRSRSINPEAARSIKQAISYIQENYREQIAVNDLATMCGYSVYHFIRLFREMTQWTPVQFLNRCRINNAKRLLLETNQTVEEIMTQCGFHNYSYFFRIFKSQCGIVPMQFRKKHKL